MKRFLLQCDENKMMWELPNALREAIDAENDWRAMAPRRDPTSDSLSYIAASLEQVQRGDCGVLDVIPVGSVEYVDAILSLLGRPPLRALNVPQELRDPGFLGRNVFGADDRGEVERVLAGLGERGRLLVKPGDVPKRFDAQSVSLGDLSVLDRFPGPYFLSDVLLEDIVAEWRVFFHRGRIISARPYLLPDWVCPDRSMVESMLKAWTNAPSAGTLDIAILESGTNILLEAHQFIACGLYGFDGPDLIRMSRDAWRWELAQNI